jgi:ionotropic glutamate receptor
MLKESSVQLFGNDRFEGFAIDLIHELAVMEGFNYTFLIRDDKTNGAKNETTQKWSGMIGDVIEGVGFELSSSICAQLRHSFRQLIWPSRI